MLKNELKMVSVKMVSFAAAMSMCIGMTMPASASVKPTATGNASVFRLAQDKKGESSLEKTKHFVKIFQEYEPTKKIYDEKSIPDATEKIAVTFEITDYDLDKEYAAYWGYGMVGDNGEEISWKTTENDLIIDGNGTYNMLFDVKENIGSTVSADGMKNLQMVFTLADDEDTAAGKQICLAVTDVECFTEGETVDVKTAKISDSTTVDTTGIPAIEVEGKTPQEDNSTLPAEENVGKDINILKLTSYKKGAVNIKGITIKKANVTVKAAGRTYKTKSNASGKFSVKLKTKLKKSDTIKITVKKSGYNSKTKSFVVK